MVFFSRPHISVMLLAGSFVSAHVERNLQAIRSVYNLTLYPNNIGVHTNSSNAVPAGLFNENATGRISPIGNFTSYQDSIEYFFGLSPVPSDINGNLGFYKADVVEYTSGCPEVAASVVHLYAGEVDIATGAYIGNKTTQLKQVYMPRTRSF